MYGQGGVGQGGVVGGATSTVAGVAVLPNTGGNTMLTYLAVTAIVLGSVAVLVQLAVIGYRRSALRQL